MHKRKAKGVMIKLDISRGFDSISWSFLFEVLRAKGFLELWCSRLAILLSIASLGVIVNGCHSRKFRHAKGLRQGESVSSLLFVIAMDSLTCMMIKAQQMGAISAMPSCTPFQRLSIYADDVILFIQPIVSDLSFFREALQIFGTVSSLHINYAKSSAIMIRSEEEDTLRVAQALPWRMETFPCKYLGLQLLIKQLTKAEWQPIVDQVFNFMPGWQRGLVTRLGRLILVNNVIRARPTHHLLVADAPKWALDAVDKAYHAFFWAGSDHIHGGKCLVAWQRVCRPKHLGGLGVIDLHKQGLALRLCWEWLKQTDDRRPWQGLSMVMDESTKTAFSSLVQWNVGDGKHVLFWQDRWLNGSTVAELAPLVREKVLTQVVNKRTVF